MAKVGNPSKYETHVAPYLEEIKVMAWHMSERQLAKELGVGYSTFCRYKEAHEELRDAMKKGRRKLVTDLRSALIKKAEGFYYTETKRRYKSISIDDPLRAKLLADGYDIEELQALQEVDTEVHNKYSPPDVAALNLALKNYDRENWANDPQLIALRKEELKLRERQIENAEW